MEKILDMVQISLDIPNSIINYITRDVPDDDDIGVVVLTRSKTQMTRPMNNNMVTMIVRTCLLSTRRTTSLVEEAQQTEAR